VNFEGTVDFKQTNIARIGTPLHVALHGTATCIYTVAVYMCRERCDSAGVNRIKSHGVSTACDTTRLYGVPQHCRGV